MKYAHHHDIHYQVDNKTDMSKKWMIQSNTVRYKKRPVTAGSHRQQLLYKKSHTYNQFIIQHQDRRIHMQSQATSSFFYVLLRNKKKEKEKKEKNSKKINKTGNIHLK